MSGPKFGVTDAKLKEVVGVALDAIIAELKNPPKGPEAPADPMQGGYMVLNAGTGRCGNAMSVIRLVADVWGDKQAGGIFGADPQTSELMGLVTKQLKRHVESDDWKDGDKPE